MLKFNLTSSHYHAIAVAIGETNRALTLALMLWTMDGRQKLRVIVGILLRINNMLIMIDRKYVDT